MWVHIYVRFTLTVTSLHLHNNGKGFDKRQKDTILQRCRTPYISDIELPSHFCDAKNVIDFAQT
jgi:hypothetical protein